MVEYEIKYQDRIFKSLEDFEDFVFKKTGMKAIFNPTLENAAFFTTYEIVWVPVRLRFLAVIGEDEIDVKIEDSIEELAKRAMERAEKINKKINRQSMINTKLVEEVITKRIQ